MARLSCFVHVDGVAYGPNDDLPAEVVARITNPDVWAEDPTATAPEQLPAPKSATPRRRKTEPAPTGD